MKSKKYTCVVYDKKTQELLKNWCIENGFDISVNWKGEPKENFEFHTSIIYSKNEVELEDSRFDFSDWHPKHRTVTPIGFKYLTNTITGKDEIPVMLIKSEAIDSFYLYETGVTGLIHSYDKLIPHITLSYVYKDIKDLKLPDFDIVFDNYVIESLKD
jgi:hypothetical protein